MKLSFTKVEKYITCPRLYKYYYIDNYREITMSSALFFGSYLGLVFQQMCLSKKETLSPEELAIKDLDPWDYFNSIYKTVTINDIKYDLPDCHLIRYFKGDAQYDILTQEDKDLIYAYRAAKNIWIPFNELLDRYMGYKTSEDETRVVNYEMWVSTRRKAFYMIKTFKEEILPKIHKVYAIEKRIELKNEVDDMFEGYIDITMDLEDSNGQIKRTVLDFKTSTAKYEADALNTKMQLSFYNYVEEAEQVGYLVFLKNIKQPKNGPRKGTIYADYQFLLGKIPDEIVEEHIQKADKVLQAIKDEKFEQNYPSEGCVIFGHRCFAYELCRGSGSDRFMFKKERK